MDAGHIIILHLRSKPDSIGHLRLSLALTIIPLRIYGHWLVLFLKWLLETFCLNREKARIMTKMMITWLRWWNFLEECQRTWLFLERTQRNFLIARVISEEFLVSTFGHWRKFLLRNIRSEKMKLRLLQISCCLCLHGTMKQELLLSRCWNTPG